MKKILFVCHGNICRSVTAQWIFADLVRKAGLENEFEIDSAALSSEETGCSIYPPAARTLKKHGIPFGDHCTRPMTQHDVDDSDHIYYMDGENLSRIKRRVPSGQQSKCQPLLSRKAIADPWYSGDFETAFREIREGCLNRLKELTDHDD